MATIHSARTGPPPLPDPHGGWPRLAMTGVARAGLRQVTPFLMPCMFRPRGNTGRTWHVRDRGRNMHGAEDGGNAPEPPHWIAAAGCAGLAMTGNERGGKVGAGGNGRRCRHRERSEAIQIGGCGHHRGRWIATAPAGASRHAQLITIVNAQMRDAIGQQAARRN